MQERRALWLLNHTTLRNFEVPLLIELGYEVFCPKIFQYGLGVGSASIEWKYDETLSIPKEDLDKLNQTDLYDDVSQDIKDIMNKYFDVVFFDFFPEQFEMLINSFSGTFVFKAFGLPLNNSYTECICDKIGIHYLSKIEKLKERFFFGQVYPNLSEIESRCFQNRTVDLPVGLAESHLKGQWVGGDTSILFICPEINTSGYFKNAYNDFKHTFKGFDYAIGGAQPIAVKNDTKVLGSIPKEQYDYNMTHLSAMYYHSTEKRHIHYHPFEAIQIGMPLLFMGGGMMDTLGGEKLPGRCMSEAEVRKKAKLLANGDRRFIREITSTQNVLLKHFDVNECKKKWVSALKQIEVTYRSNRNTTQKKRSQKMAVILPWEYTEGVLDYTMRLIKCILMGAKEQGDSVEVVFGYVDEPIFKERDYFKELRDKDVLTRPFEWRIVNDEWVKNASFLSGIPIPFSSLEQAYCVMEDGMLQFEDCDFIILTADRVPNNLYCNKPYAVVVHDYIQRYLPDVISAEHKKYFIDAQRKATAVFVTSDSTYDDALQYGGIKKEKLHLTPLMFDLVYATKENPETHGYFLWSTNAMPHKNHKVMLQALSSYYINNGELLCYITGTNTHCFNIDEDYEATGDYVCQIRSIIKDDDYLKDNIKVLGNLPKPLYLNILSGAKFFIHTGYADNGNGAAIDAACLGTPTLSSDYPAMRYIDDTMNLKMTFFDPFDSDSIKEKLFYAEKNYEQMANQLPNISKLANFTVENSYKEVYQIIQKIMNI